ncbi:MAG: hypothetical protein JXQ75_01070 [Phycisphaerae bacterium]|nr:hypothetical protein [Phycisphaerae bacterium]
MGRTAFRGLGGALIGELAVPSGEGPDAEGISDVALGCGNGGQQGLGRIRRWGSLEDFHS